MKKRLINLAVAVAFVAVSIFLYNRYYKAHDIALNAIQIEGNQQLSDYVHPPTIVHFYASWCGPCMRELPEIINYATTSSTTYELVLITDDAPETIDAVKLKYPGDYSIYRVNSLKENNIYTIPATYYVNEKLEIVLKELGEGDWKNIEFSNKIEDLVK